MQFRPYPAIDPVDTTIIPSPHSFPKLIRTADVTVMTGAFGRILQQEERTKQYLLTKHCFELISDKTMLLTTDEAMLVLSYTLEGDMTIQHSLLGPLHHSANSGYLYYLPAGYHELAVPAGHCTTIKLHINLDLLELACYGHPQLGALMDRVREGCPQGWVMPVKRIKHPDKRLLRLMTTCTKTGGHRKLFMDRCIEDLLELYIASHNKPPKNDRRDKIPERHRESLLHVEQNLGKDGVMFDDMKRASRKLGMTVWQLARACKYVWQHGWPSFQKRKKIAEACNLLLTTDKTVQEICYELRYEDASSFCRSFREEIGCSPEQYRKDKKVTE